MDGQNLAPVGGMKPYEHLDKPSTNWCEVIVAHSGYNTRRNMRRQKPLHITFGFSPGKSMGLSRHGRGGVLLPFKPQRPSSKTSHHMAVGRVLGFWDPSSSLVRSLHFLGRCSNPDPNKATLLLVGVPLPEWVAQTKSDGFVCFMFCH